MPRKLIAMLSPLLLLGCLPSDSDPGDNSGGGNSVFCETGLVAGNEYMPYHKDMTGVYCGIHPDQQADADPGQNLCITFMLAAGISIQAHIIEGRACFNNQQADRCLQAVRPLVPEGEALDQCSLPEADRTALDNAMAAMCASVVEGTVQAGGACGWEREGGHDSTDLVCQGTTICVEDVCAAARSAGETCAASDDCVPGHYCSEDRSCVRQLSLGADCLDNDDCSSEDCDLNREVCVDPCD